MRTHFPPASPTDGSMNQYFKEHFAKQRAEDAAKAAEATQVVAKAPCDVCGLESPCAPCLGLAAYYESIGGYQPTMLGIQTYIGSLGLDTDEAKAGYVRQVEEWVKARRHASSAVALQKKYPNDIIADNVKEPDLLYVSSPVKYPDGSTTGCVLQEDQTITVEAEGGEFLLAERGALPPLKVPVRLEWLADGMVIGEGKSCRIPDEHVGKEITYRAYRKPETPADVLSEAYRKFKGY